MAKHYNGAPGPNFKIQHIRDNFSIQVDDMTKMPKLISFFQKAENTFLYGQVSPILQIKY